MRRSPIPILLAWPCLLFFVSPASAQFGQILGRSLAISNMSIGFGARALAMGGAFIAIADDITAMSYNPAGLAQLVKPEMSLGGRFGGQLIKVPEAFYDWSDIVGYGDTATVSAYNIRFSSPSLDYAGGIVPFRIAKIPVVLGIAYQRKAADTADFTYEYAIDETRETGESILATITDDWVQKGGTQALAFSLAIRPLEFLHIGFNINRWRGKSELHWDAQRIYEYYFQGVLQSTEEVPYRLDNFYEMTGGTNYDLGILLKHKGLSAGFVYKTGFRCDYSVNEDTLSRIILWPFSYGFGLAFRLTELLTLAGDYTFTNWSAGSLEYPDGGTSGFPAHSPRDTFQIRMGVEYLLLLKNLSIPLRAGGFSDRAYWADIEGNPVTYRGLTLGTGLVRNSYRIDFAALYHFGKSSDENTADIITRVGWSFHTSISFRFGRD